MRTFTVEFVYDVSCDAESQEQAEAKAYRWLMKLQDNPDRELPDDVWSVRTLPMVRTVFAGAEKEAV